MLFVVSAVLFDMLKARQLACVSKSGQKCPAALSLSSWRAWIEILTHGDFLRKNVKSLSSWRAWIEITTATSNNQALAGRSPHGERGLKCGLVGIVLMRMWSLSSWRAWIEMCDVRAQLCRCFRSLSSWRAWIEIKMEVSSIREIPPSLSSWRAWIEIVCAYSVVCACLVALLMESVD